MRTVLVCGTFATLISLCFTLQQSPLPAQAKQHRVLSVEDISSSTVIGRLGKELGQVFTIEGKIVADTSRAKGRDGMFLVEIEIVDGMKLSNPVAFVDADISHDWFIRPKDRPMNIVGRRLKLAVYETGIFDGLPKGDRYSPVIAGHGFHFRSRLRVVHDFAEGLEKHDGNVPSPFRSSN